MKSAVCLVLLLLGSCGGSEPGLRAIVGGKMEASLESKAVEDAVIVISGGKIREAGPSGNVSIPEDAERIDAQGKLIRPMPYDGKIAPGEPASFMVFDAASGAPERVMQDGEWVQ